MKSFGQTFGRHGSFQCISIHCFARNRCSWGETIVRVERKPFKHLVTKMTGMLKPRKNRQSESTHSKFRLNKQKQKVMHSEKKHNIKSAFPLGGGTSTPANNDVCLLTFAWRRSRITMTSSAEIRHFGCSETSVMIRYVRFNSKYL